MILKPLPSYEWIYCQRRNGFPSNWRSEFTLDEYFKLKNIPELLVLIRRKLTRIIRQHGTLKGALCHINENVEEVLEGCRLLRFVAIK